MKTVVIVAAGLSSRLYPLTINTPKSLLPLGKERILERNIRLLKENGFEQIIIVTGYLKEMIEKIVGPSVSTIYNPFYKYCNNMGSLYAVKHIVENNPFLYLHGDVVFSEKLFKQFISQSNGNNIIDLAVDFKETDEEAMKVRIDEEFNLIESNKDIPLTDSAGEWIGLAAIHRPESVFDYIEAILVEEKLNVYDTFAFTEMANNGFMIKCHSINNEPWMEIDFIEDYEKAKELFADE
ncbi:NTP transferase domain-containing protein [Lysinibacillus sp. NPDC093210]|uniref:phosphocholine cytidylyltransferase family protein n=1 Tax=Lysinibacillus sp. NPDC093210 TaxID=3364133 RepID=UPI003827EA35